jgi:hypothetical protein
LAISKCPLVGASAAFPDFLKIHGRISLFR